MFNNLSNIQICWRGIVHDSTGYARASREYLLALDRLGIDVKIEPMNFGTPPTELNKEQVDRINYLINKPHSVTKRKMLIYHAQPNGVSPLVEKNKYDYVVINTVWETTKVPDNWFPNVNQADAVIVPSKMNVKSLVDSGVTVPIYLVPHGVDSTLYNPNNPKLEIPELNEKFIFLSIFQWQFRKAPGILLEAFWREFTINDNVALIVKTYAGGSRESGRQIRQQIANYKYKLQLDHEPAITLLTTSNFSDKHLLGLYTASDIFVLPSRGEGVGLPYLEALASGIPVIATGWGGQMDFLNDSNAYFINHELASTRSKMDEALAPDFHGLFTAEMKWAEPSVDSLRANIRSVYEHQEIVKQKGTQARNHVESMTWDWVGTILSEALSHIVGQ